MGRRPNKHYLLGYEDYFLKTFNSSVFFDDYYDHPISPSTWMYTYGYKYRIPIEEDWKKPEITGNDHLLASAKKVYIHPECKIPRALVSKKYKRCLKTHDADIVVIPDNIFEHKTVYYEAYFSDGVYLYFTYFSSKEQERISDKFTNARPNCTFVELIPEKHRDITLQKEPQIANSQLVYCGKVLSTDSECCVDYISHLLPESKIVLESSLLKALNDQSNALTFDNMKSIIDMFKSSDTANSGLALKLLAAMDYVKYAQSVTAVLFEFRNNWRYCNERNSTAVKFMLNSLDVRAFGYTNYHSNTISAEDYELFEKVMRYMNNLDNIRYFNLCQRLPFVFIDQNFNIVPRLKTEEAVAS